MAMLQQLINQYGSIDCRDLGSRQLEQLKYGIKDVTPEEISSAIEGKAFIDLLRKFREAVAENDKLHGENYPKMLNSLLSVGEDGLYSNSLRFIFELIQNVDDCEYPTYDDCTLDMRFDFEQDEIILTYNEKGFTPFNVFAITGIAEAAKNVSSSKNEIGEKGIGFKSVFGVAKRVLIRSGWFSFELLKDNFTIPVSSYNNDDYYNGTQMILYVPGKAQHIYKEIKQQYCKKDALFSRNPLLFLNKLTSLKFYFDSFRSMEFHVSRSEINDQNKINIERNVEISVDLNDYDNGLDVNVKESITCSRYSYPVTFSREACKSRYGDNTQVGINNGKPMILRCVVPNKECIGDIGCGALYSFLPTQLKFTVPIVCHVPFKLDASREFVDPQNNNIWFKESSEYLSELMDEVYSDWRTVAKENIVRYIPGKRENLFAENNGKEKCLTNQISFEGSHFLELPIFYGIDGQYHKSDDIFCFDEQEKISEPERVYRLMGYRIPLFISPVSVRKYNIKIEKNVLEKLLNKALSVPDNTGEILDYLDAVEFTYIEKLINMDTAIQLSAGQIETILCHESFATLLQNMACNEIQNNRRLRIDIKNESLKNIADVINADFELSDTPKQVRNYMKYCSEQCLCLNIANDTFFPCVNAIILSNKAPLTSFVEFCRHVDPKDPFTTRITWREKSNELNRYVEDTTIPENEYLRVLRQIRISIKDSLGNNGYRSYIELILKSGTDKGRFIQELLQNADDCIYPENETPTFSLSQHGNIVTTEYNEVGFNRSNIRSITAIGESTKNKLLTNDVRSIGEKGVGFKTIFAVASEVRIHSGDYHFKLTSLKPTIPDIINDSAIEKTSGTKMEITIKSESSLPKYKAKELLELCLCLRNLKRITIDSHNIIIIDTDNTRLIVIDNQEHSFKRYTHRFTVSDKSALNERNNEVRAISPEQEIVCFVPEKGGLLDYYLYNGLPTKHKSKIPLVIDAPFSLTTSREEIETDSSSWNNVIRIEMYQALLLLIEELKINDRSKIFRFLRFVPRLQGTTRVYVNDIFDCKYLIENNPLNLLKTRNILPTYDKNIFAVPMYKTAYRFSEAITYIFSKLEDLPDYAGISASSIIDIDSKEYDAALNALECHAASFHKAYPIIEKYAYRFIDDKDFSTKLYDYLKDSPDDYRVKIRELPIIPVFDKIPGKVKYISWKENSIFVKPGTNVYCDDYYVLNESLLLKSDCEKIFSANINEMNVEWERTRYNEHLRDIVMHNDNEEVFEYLISEFRSNAFLKNSSFGVLQDLIQNVPWKNELNQIFCGTIFTCNQPSGYFPTEMLQKITAKKECEKFAIEMHCRELSDIHYENIDYHQPLTEDDVECLQDNYFNNSEEILRGFYREGLLSDELLSEYELDYLAYGRADENEDYYEFPSVLAGNRQKMASHIRELWRNPINIISVKIERTVKKGQSKDGSTFELSSGDSRNGALSIYAPEGYHDKCFCQMCRSIKSNKLIEVNNIESEPEYYFPQMRIALCLECSKRFEALRGNKNIRKAFRHAIMSVKDWSEGIIDVSLGNEETITFTAKHLAEIQEIMKQRPNQ